MPTATLPGDYVISLTVVSTSVHVNNVRVMYCMLLDGIHTVVDSEVSVLHH